MSNKIILYNTEDGKSKIELHVNNETVWLSQLELAELFQTNKQNISKHINAILKDKELEEKVVVNYQLTTAAYGIMPSKTQMKKSCLLFIKDYWYRVKNKKREERELSTFCRQLKLEFSDVKKYNADVLVKETLLINNELNLKTVI